MDSKEPHFNLYFLTHWFSQYRGLALRTQRTIAGCFPEVYLRLTLKHGTLFDKKREIRPEQQTTLTCEIKLVLFLVSSILVGSLTGVVSILVQADGCSTCCIHQYCRVPYQCCVYGRRSSG